MFSADLSLSLSLQMPSVTTGDNAVHSSSPDLAWAPSETLKQVLNIIDKKVRNMEKRKVILCQHEIELSHTCDLFLEIALFNSQ